MSCHVIINAHTIGVLPAYFYMSNMSDPPNSLLFIDRGVNVVCSTPYSRLECYAVLYRFWQLCRYLKSRRLICRYVLCSHTREPKEKI